MHFKNRDIVSIDHLSNDEILYLLTKAKELKEKPEFNKLNGHVYAEAFFEPSTRTRLSFLRAAQKQGMHIIGFDSTEGTSLKKNESTHHTLEMLKRYEAEVFVLRHGWDGAAQYAADLFNVPIINAGDGKHEHPTQTLLDLFTILETQGRLDNLTLALAGDLRYGRTVHSLIKALRRFPGNTFVLISPEQLQLPPEYTETPDGKTRKDIIHSTIDEAARTCDVIYMTRIQQERFDDQKEWEQVRGTLHISTETLTQAKRNLKILHPLPIDADNPEIAKTLYREKPEHAYYFDQAANGLIVREVLLCAVLGKIGDDFKGAAYTPPQRSDKNNFEHSPIDDITRAKEINYLYSIENGIVIDHIPAGQGEHLYRMMNLGSTGKPRMFAGNLNSNRVGKKDLIKLVDHELRPQELNTISIICPDATVSVIRQGHVKEKYKVRLPDKITGLLECQNNRCISRNPREDAPSIFYTLSRNPAILSCHYCDTQHSLHKGNIKLL